jgi:Fe2+ or Zn2+ uptake regulation protein
MDEDNNLKNGIRVEMDQFNLIVFKESTEEIAGREAKSVLKHKGKHHNFICIGCGKVIAGGRTPLQHSAVWEKVVWNKFMNLTFICGRCFK